MQLIMSPASPYVYKCRVVIREVGLLDQVEEVNVATTPLKSDPKALAANPTGKIPSLVRPDGPAIYDSRVITRFLNDKAKANLYAGEDAWDILTLEATGDAIMDAAVSISYETRLRPENEQSPAWVDAQWGKIMGAISALQNRWMAHLNGPLNIGQIGVACGLSYIDFRHDARGWRKGHDTMAAWYEEFSKRPSMIDAAPKV
ncbi:MAG: glutathione S-transferase [Planktomarina sp.]